MVVDQSAHDHPSRDLEVIGRVFDVVLVRPIRVDRLLQAMVGTKKLLGERPLKLLRSRLVPSRDDQVTEWIGGRHGIAVAGALFLVLEPSFERIPGLRQRPDILGEPSPASAR